MNYFICDSCGGEVDIYDGVVSWCLKKKELSNFKITHEEGCIGRCAECERKTEKLYKIVSMSGYLNFVQYLINLWSEGYEVRHFKELKGIMRQVENYVFEKFDLLIGD